MLSPAALRGPSLTVEDVVRNGHVQAVFQPVVHLATGAVVGYEALARGPHGTALERPTALFAAARQAGVLAELDWACRAAAVRAALAAGMGHGMALFVNVEPETLSAPVPDALRPLIRVARRRLNLVFELTERALTERPAELLAGIERLRHLGCSLALDDVGADAGSLALMPFVAPDVIKLDLRIVQDAPSQIAATFHAANAEAERSGALLVAEGIETPEHLDTARALGAEYGQGWLLGRPGALPGVLPPAPVHVGSSQRTLFAEPARTPFETLTAAIPTRPASRTLLAALSRELETRAREQGGYGVVLAALPGAEDWTAAVRDGFTELTEHTAFVAVLGPGIPTEPAPGVRGVALTPGEPLGGEWCLAVVGPHFAAALTARGLPGPAGEARYEYALTYDRPLAVRAATALMARVAPVAPARPAAV